MYFAHHMSLDLRRFGASLSKTRQIPALSSVCGILQVYQNSGRSWEKREAGGGSSSNNRGGKFGSRLVSLCSSSLCSRKGHERGDTHRLVSHCCCVPVPKIIFTAYFDRLGTYIHAFVCGVAFYHQPTQ